MQDIRDQGRAHQFLSREIIFRYSDELVTELLPVAWVTRQQEKCISQEFRGSILRCHHRLDDLATNEV